MAASGHGAFRWANWACSGLSALANGGAHSQRGAGLGDWLGRAGTAVRRRKASGGKLKPVSAGLAGKRRASKREAWRRRVCVGPLASLEGSEQRAQSLAARAEQPAAWPARGSGSVEHRAVLSIAVLLCDAGCPAAACPAQHSHASPARRQLRERADRDRRTDRQTALRRATTLRPHGGRRRARQTPNSKPRGCCVTDCC